MTSNGTRFEAAEDEMSVSRKEMHALSLDVSNLIKLSRPPEGIRDVELRLRRCDWNAPAVEVCERWERDLGPRMPFGWAGEEGGEGVRGLRSGVVGSGSPFVPVADGGDVERALDGAGLALLPRGARVK